MEDYNTRSGHYYECEVEYGSECDCAERYEEEMQNRIIWFVYKNNKALYEKSFNSLEEAIEYVQLIQKDIILGDIDLPLEKVGEAYKVGDYSIVPDY